MMSYNLSDDEPELETLDISNDYYYQPIASRLNKTAPVVRVPHSEKLCIPIYGSSTIRHTLAAYDLWKPFFPTYVSEFKFPNFHRPKLRHFNNGPQSKNREGFYPELPIKSLSRNIFRSHVQLKNKVAKAIEDGMSRDDIMSKFLLIREARQMSAKCGELILFEYCEEFPPVLSQIGMASNVKIYSYGPQNQTPFKAPKHPNPITSTIQIDQNRLSNQCDPVKSRQVSRQIGFEETIKGEQASKRVYFNPMKAGSQYKMIENNLYRAPIYEHELQNCDFLVVRTRNSYYIRQVNKIFTVGQTLPLQQIPVPSESNIQRFRCDLSNLYIHKLFKASETNPPQIRLDDLTRLFPDYDEPVLLRRMSSRGVRPISIRGEKYYVKGTSSYGDMSTLKLRNSFKPEGYCLNMSMLAARQRLRELNYSETMIHPMKPVELEPEVLAAPWNTSKAVINMMAGKSYLDLDRHLIDPTGQSREGFSCVSSVKSPTEEAQAKELESQSKQPREAGSAPVPPRQQFVRNNPLRHKITQEKIKRLALYQKEAQMISDIQARCLSLDDTITSSEDEDDREADSENMSETDFCQQLSTLSRMVIDGRNNQEVSHEDEEAERRRMLIEFQLKDNCKDNEQPAQPKPADEYDPSLLKDKVLYITRSYEYEGKIVTGAEIVRDRRIIALYVKQKGGSLLPSRNSTTNSDIKQSKGCNGIGDGGDSLSGSINHRPRSGSLGPTEMCRAEGTRLRISKKVLECVSPIKNRRRRSARL